MVKRQSATWGARRAKLYGPGSTLRSLGRNARVPRVRAAAIAVIAALIFAGSLFVANSMAARLPSVSSSVCPATTASVSTGCSTWVWENPRPEGNPLSAVSCATTSICYAVAGGATACGVQACHQAPTFLASSDGGSSWRGMRPPPSGTSLQFFDPGLACPSALTCVVAGNGSLSRTDDGGTTWQTQSVAGYNLDTGVRGLACPDVSACYVVGASTVLSTKNAGATPWTSQYLPYTNAISCPNAITCFVLDEAGVTYTTNGGTSWSANVATPYSSNIAISCPTTQVCFVVGFGGQIARSADGGVTWVAQTAVAGNLLTIECASALHCVAVSDSTGPITTDDGGAIWTARSAPLPTGLGWGVSCPSSTVCVAAQWRNLVTSSDSGHSWTLVTTGHPGVTSSPDYLSSISCPTDNSCVAVGTSYGALVRSPSTGSWAPGQIPNGIELQGVSCPTTTDCYAAGSAVAHTSDAGATWSELPGSTSAHGWWSGISCGTSSSCVAVNASDALSIQNSGAQLITRSPAHASFAGVSCVDAHECYAAGNNGMVMTTTDGGLTWGSIPAPVFFTAIGCPNPLMCVGVGYDGNGQPSAARTQDGGASWDTSGLPSSMSPNAIACSISLSCFVGGASGSAATSIDGGHTWAVEETGTGLDLYGVECVTHCRAVGNVGTILANQVALPSGPGPSPSASPSTSPGPSPLPTPKPTPGAPYVALGDSYSSGDGNRPYYAGTEGDGQCHRSHEAYPVVISTANGVPGPLDFEACSGALIAPMIQNQAPHVGPATRLATVGIGGNNVDFADKAELCLNPFAASPSLDSCEARYDSVIVEAMEVIDGTRDTPSTQPTLKDAFSKVVDSPGSRRTLAVGYPRWFQTDPPWLECAIGFGGLAEIRKSDADWINRRIQLLDQVIHRNAVEAGAEYVDVLDAFDGHELCSPTQQPYMFDAGPGGDAPLHPTADGQNRLAQLVLQRWRNAGDPTIQLALGERKSTVFQVGTNQSGLGFTTSWPGSNMVVSLESPSGDIITPATLPPGALHQHSATRDYYYIPDPTQGAWTVSVLGVDVTGGSETVTIHLDSVPDFVLPPLASAIAGSTTGSAPLSVDFDASASRPTDEPITSYTWDFGDGESGSGDRIDHVYPRPGTYAPKVTVGTASGATGVAAAGPITVGVSTPPGLPRSGAGVAAAGNLESPNMRIAVTWLVALAITTGVLLGVRGCRSKGRRV